METPGRRDVARARTRDGAQLISFFRRRRTHEDFADEIEAHLDLEADRLIGEGWTHDRAREEARRRFGNVALARERFYETSRWIWLDQFVRDLRYGWRTLCQNPSFFATAVVTLMVGIGLSTMAFTVFNAYVLRPYAVRSPAGLHHIGWRSETSGGMSFRWNDYLELEDRNDLFDGVVAETMKFVTSESHALAAGLVSNNYFDTLGPRVLLGRTFTAMDEEPVVVLSNQAWRRLYAGDESVVGPRA